MTAHSGDQSLPPADLDAERALLGACLQTARALDEAIQVIDPRDFYRPAHEELFTAMIAMRDQSREVDPITLAAHLGDRLRKLGGAPYIAELYGGVATATNVTYYAEIIADKAIRRRLLETGQRAMQLAHTDGETGDVVESVRAALDVVAARARGDVTASELDYLGKHALTRYADPAPAAVATGFPDLDRMMTGGYRPGTLVIIGARPATGKSLIGLCSALHVARHGEGVLIVSLEMTENELVDRAVANLAGVELDKLTRHSLSDSDWLAVQDAADRLRGVPLAVVDHPHIGVTGIRSLARDRLRTTRGLGLLVIDYLGLMRPADTRVDRHEQVAAMSRGLKLLAKELHVPIVALHQLNRQPESRANRRPVLSDLRESGQLEQDADVVWLLHRDEADEERRYELEVMIAKNRQGRTGSVFLNWQPEFGRVTAQARFDGT